MSKAMRRSSVVVERSDTDIMARLKRLREYMGMTQADFAESFDIPPSTYRKWENGDRTPPDYVVTLLEKAVEHDNK